MGAYTLRGEVGGGWALEFPSFLGPVKWERAVIGLQKGRPSYRRSLQPSKENIPHFKT
jgi:hypothetical protein